MLKIPELLKRLHLQLLVVVVVAFEALDFYFDREAWSYFDRERLHEYIRESAEMMESLWWVQHYNNC